MKVKLLLLLIFTNTLSFGQGLNAELGFNAFYHEEPISVVCVDEYTYLSNFQIVGNSFFSISSIYKIDTLGNILWNKQVKPSFGEFTQVYEMIPSETGGIYVSGYLRPVCDLVSDCQNFIQKYDAAGEVLWTKIWIEEQCANSHLTGLSLNAANEVVINYADEQASHIYTLDSEGNEVSSLETSLSELGGFENIPGYGNIAFKENMLYRISNTGALTDLATFQFYIQDMQLLNDSLYVMTSDSIFIFDTGMQVLQTNATPGYTDFSKLKVSANTVSFIVNGSATQQVVTLDKELQWMHGTIVPVPLIAGTLKKDFSSSHFSAGIDFALTEYRTVRYKDYSLHSEENAPVNTTDITVLDLLATQVNTIPVQPANNIYTTEIYAEALIQNVGTNMLDDCILNHHIGASFVCGELFFRKQFSNLNLAPGESTWVTLGLVHSTTGLRSPQTTNMDICVFSSHPNFKTDLNVPNDKLCKSVYIGSVGIEEQELSKVSLLPNPTSGILKIQSPLENLHSYSICNLQGQEVQKGRLLSDEIDLTPLASGFYVLHATFTDGTTGAGNIIVKE